MAIIQTSPINIYTESNPNPNSLKFVANIMMLPEGISRDYPSKEQASDAPLASLLFELPYVKRVFYMSNFITVTKEENVDWYEVKSEITQLIKSFLESGESIILEKFNTTPSENSNPIEETEVERKIKDVLEEYIKPAVEMDGGAIAFHSFENGVVKVQLQGSCSGCPSSTITLKNGIENLLKRMIPQVETVVAEGI